MRKIRLSVLPRGNLKRVPKQADKRTWTFETHNVYNFIDRVICISQKIFRLLQPDTR